MCDGFHTLSAPLCGIAMLPKTTCNVRAIEISRFLVLTQSTVTPLSFSLPRSEKLKTYFQDDVYGFVRAMTTGGSTDYYLNGGNVVPDLVSLQPSDMTKLSEKPEDIKVRPKVVDFKQKLDKEKQEKEIQEANFARMTGLANQRAAYHPNYSMGMKGVDAARVEDSDDSSDGGWDD